MAHYNDFISQSLINTKSSPINVFDEMDLLHSLIEEEDFYRPSAPCNTPISDDSLDSYNNDIYIPQIRTENDIDSENYMTKAISEETFKHPPKSSKDAYYVWKDANLPKYASKSLIESQLTKWAIQNAFINSTSNHDISEWTITWKTKYNTSCTSKFTTFIKWMLCACSRQSQV